MRFVLKKIGNIIWKILGGAAYSAIWIVLGIAFTLSIIGFPLGLKCYKIGRLIWKPFGKSIVLGVARYPIINTLWASTVGMLLGIVTLVPILATALTIVGLPLSKQWIKVAKVTFFPFGTIIK